MVNAEQFVSSLKRMGLHLWAFIRYLLRRFDDEGGFVWAGLLCYATLFALVPLTALTVSVIAAFPVFDQWISALQDFVFTNFVPTAGETVRGYLNQFAGQARGLTASSTAALFLTALVLMSNIEKAFNKIWHVSESRPFISRFMIYWAVLTMGPVLIGASLAVSSYVFSSQWLADSVLDPGLRASLLKLLPMFSAFLAFSMLYLIVPNRAVYWRHALAGGFLAALLFELAKTGFAAYVAAVPTYQKLYGAVSTVAIFLLWLYICWVVTLFGATFTAALGAFKMERSESVWPRQLEFVLLFRIVGYLWRAQRDGRVLQEHELQSLESDASDEQLQRLLNDLRVARIAGRDDRGGWMLLRDPSELTLLDLYRCGLYVLPLEARVGEPLTGRDAWDRALLENLASLSEPVNEGLSRPLKPIYQQSEQGDD